MFDITQDRIIQQARTGLGAVMRTMSKSNLTCKVPLVAFLALGMASKALAQGGGGGGNFDVNPSDLLNDVVSQILGPMGTSLAVIGIIAIGLMWMFGRASLSLVAGVIGGIAIMFGASWIASVLVGKGGGGA